MNNYIPSQAPDEPQDWFSRIAIWVGAIALLMAGFYMVKYSIDSGWLTPAVRLWLTTCFGVSLCSGGFWVSSKAKLAGNERIGQALSGAGVACLYFAAYAAVHLYAFFSAKEGFGCMLAVTLLAVGLSLKHGVPIAMIGLVGGFATPWLMSTGTQDTAMLFSYLFLLVCGAQYLCIRRQWWGLLLGSFIGAYLWSALVIAANMADAIDNLKGTMIFIVGMCALNAIWTCKRGDRKPDAQATFMLMVIRLIAWAGGLFQALLLVWLGQFASVDLALFSVLSIGALLLAVVREENFMWAPWLALGAIAVTTLANPAPDWLSWFVWPIALGLIFFGIAHRCRLNPTRSSLWSWLADASLALITPLLYFNCEIADRHDAIVEGCWLLLATGAALFLVWASEHLRARTRCNTRKLSTVSQSQCLAFYVIAFGLWTYVPADYLAHSIAGLLITATFYWKWRSFTHADWLLGGLIALLSLVMLPLAAETFAYFFRVTYLDPAQQDHIAVFAWALTIISGFTVSHQFRTTAPTHQHLAAAWWTGLTALLGCIAGYQWLDQSIMPQQWPRAAVDGGLTSLLAILAIACNVDYRRWPKPPWASPILIVLVAIRQLAFHLGDASPAGAAFFFNALLWQWGIPLVAVSVLAWLASQDKNPWLRQSYQGFAMIIGFIWSTLLVQDYYKGTYLLSGDTSDTELYTYSVVWLLLAIAYQGIGLWRNQKVMHVGSLLLLIITVGKVFLIDASALEGIFRVLSFLGLGTSLMGIAFFYNKVVFVRNKINQSRSDRNTEANE